MMVFIHISVAVLCLLSVGETAPLSSCDSLIQPLEIREPEQLFGKWMRVAVSTNNEMASVIQTYQDSYWMRLSAENNSDIISLKGFMKVVTLVNNTFQPVINTTTEPESLISGTLSLLKTECSDCLLLQTQTHIFGKTHEALILMSKRQAVTAAEMEELEKQAECLNLPQSFSLNFDKGQCPEHLPPGSDVVDVTPLLTTADTSKQQNATEKLANMMGGMDKLVNIATDVLSKMN